MDGWMNGWMDGVMDGWISKILEIKFTTQFYRLAQEKIDQMPDEWYYVANRVAN